MGLRQYSSPSKKIINDSTEDVKSGDDGKDDGIKGPGKLATSSMQFRAMGKFKRANKNANKILTSGNENKIEKTEKRTRRPTNISTAKMHQYLREEYVTEELPRLSPHSTEKYFGENAKDKFFATYRQLKQRGEVSLCRKLIVFM